MAGKAEMICELISSVTLDHIVNLSTNVFGVLLGAALALIAQHYFTATIKRNREYAAIIEAQLALYRQHEMAQQLRKDLLDKFERGQFLPAYHSIFEAPKIPLEKIAFLAAGKKGESTDAELLHEILLAQDSYENIRLSIQRHNAHQEYILKKYDPKLANNGRIKFNATEDNFDIHLGRKNAEILYDLCPLVLSKTESVTNRISAFIVGRFPNHKSLRFTPID